MIEFLSNHFRYDTDNSSTSYASNVKIHKLGLDESTCNKISDLIQCDEFQDSINTIINDFGKNHNYLWQVGFNGRSGGYLVLYQGEKRPSMNAVLFPGRGTDMCEDFEGWELRELRERVELVQEFDKLTDEIVKEAVYLANEYDLKEEEYYMKKTRNVLAPAQ
jgi:hypothetical protein